ncbi:MAG: hypothetical protein M1825_005993 [Sarcosagium campestre]|nr:MAG: hypothetical protein M1825_005993 [Sarcosagium campestre]
MECFHFLSTICVWLALGSIGASVLHYPIVRRGGPFRTDTGVNFTFLSEQLTSAAARFNLTHREIKGNKVVRRAKASGLHGSEHGLLMGEVGRAGNWYGKLKMGVPPQGIDMDLNMLTWDFFLLSTSSDKGSPYIDFRSQTYEMTGEYPGYPSCKLPRDTVHLPTINMSMTVLFPHCRAHKSTQRTLGASGAMLGLGPSRSLSQTKTDSLLRQLVDSGVVESDMWSLMLIDEHEGVLSIGGTASDAIAQADKATKDQLDSLGNTGQASMAEDSAPAADALEANASALEKRAQRGLKDRATAEWETAWRWSRVQGAAGWWQILMQGVWVDGSKVLKNQPVIIDLNTPFILAPPLAARAFYGSISGARAMPPPHDQFYTFPCLNPPDLHFEFARWNFPVMKGTASGRYHRWPRSKFSLGRVKEGSGYCVGAVVETRMGVGDTREAAGKGGKSDGSSGGGSSSSGGGGGGGAIGGGGIDAGMTNGGNGLRDVWVLGEPFFRTVNAVFDLKEQRVGMRTY